jgi:serine/threonine protein kinase
MAFPCSEEAMPIDMHCPVQRWNAADYQMMKPLKQAPANKGRVDLMRSLETGRPVAVKRMPNSWVTAGPEDFDRKQGSRERPWVDVAIARHLTQQGCPFACKLYGLFSDDEHTYVVSAFATHGDLFSWKGFSAQPGAEREAMMRPIVAQICSGVKWLHESGISHNDLSLENIVITECDDATGAACVKLIDFGMASLEQSCRCPGMRGKPMCQAPEMHGPVGVEYDTFLADAFALGVVTFALAAQDFPWANTRADGSLVFRFIREHGFRTFLAKHEVSKSSPGRRVLKDVFSDSLVDLTEGLLALVPPGRLTLGEACWKAPRTSVWESQWLKEAGDDRFAARPGAYGLASAL